jgi:predicted short-subunit dehydrogenase-like oxidoreductase (DUF2520 family)
MKVAMIGAGNVATVMGRLLTKKGHSIIQVINRSPEPARILAEEMGCAYTDYTGQPDVSADLFIIAVSDYALQEALPKFNLDHNLVLHTAGSVSKDVLSALSDHYGVLYPLQSLRKEMKEIPGIPFLVDGNTDEVTAITERLARSLSDQVQRTNDEERLKLHAAAVIVSNFTNHLYAITEDFCKNEHVSFDLLKPLIFETASRIRDMSPADVQTGPAVRKDIQTLDKHLRTLSQYPKLRTTYLRLTDSIMNP